MDYEDLMDVWTDRALAEPAGMLGARCFDPVDAELSYVEAIGAALRPKLMRTEYELDEPQPASKLKVAHHPMNPRRAFKCVGECKREAPVGLWASRK